jgi:hypothetical protein
LIVTDRIIVPDLDDTPRTERTLSLSTDFEMHKDFSESTCASVPFACPNGCQRSDLQSTLKASAIRFDEDHYTNENDFSSQGHHLSRSTSFDWDEQSNTAETANVSVEKFLTAETANTSVETFLTRKETERGPEYKMTWPDNWMSEEEMMNTLDMILTFMSEKVRDN